MSVEQRAIATAQAYALANGFDPNERRAVGLVLAGMAVGAALPRDVANQVFDEYVKQFPESSTGQWANFVATPEPDADA